MAIQSAFSWHFVRRFRDKILTPIPGKIVVPRGLHYHTRFFIESISPVGYFPFPQLAKIPVRRGCGRDGRSGRG